MAQQIMQALMTKARMDQAEQFKQDELLAKEAEKQSRVMESELFRIRDIEDYSAKRKALAQLVLQESQAGRDPGEIVKILSNQTNDDLNLGITRLATAQGVKSGLMQKSQELAMQQQFAGEGDRFEPITDAQGNVIAQRNLTTGKVISDPRAPKAQEPKGFQQGTGIMSGFAFNPETGEFKQSAEAQLALQLDAEAKAKKDKLLSGKDLAGVNDKVTGLVKGVNEIRGAAQSLEALEDRATPAAQLAAVFKFMKAMDPSSTVRESEQGQVYSAEGAMKGFANRINQLLGQGGLSKEGFADLVDTAKQLANTSIDTTEQSVDGYLNVLSDNLTNKQYNDLKSRVPGRLEIQERLPTGVSEEQIQFTMQKYGMTREQVLEELKRRGG
jgi:hypothetical protein